jgi:hypothetical protein
MLLALPRCVDGIIVLGSAHTVVDSQVIDRVGCKRGCGYQISLDGGEGNLIARNEDQRTMRNGIRIDAFVPDLPTADNVVRDNLVTDATVDGLSIGRPAATLPASIAKDNSGLRIEGVPRVIDGGGNTKSSSSSPEIRRPVGHHLEPRARRVPRAAPRRAARARGGRARERTTRPMPQITRHSTAATTVGATKPNSIDMTVSTMTSTVPSAMRPSRPSS